MRWSITLGSFKGTAVRIHVTFILLLAWIGFSAYRSGGLETARDSVLFILLIFTCVLLHEFGHILMARRFGIVSTEVTLLPIGGVANLDHMPEKPCAGAARRHRRADGQHRHRHRAVRRAAGPFIRTR